MNELNWETSTSNFRYVEKKNELNWETLKSNAGDVEKKWEWIEKNKNNPLFIMVKNNEAMLEKILDKLNKVLSKLEDKQ